MSYSAIDLPARYDDRSIWALLVCFRDVKPLHAEGLPVGGRAIAFRCCLCLHLQQHYICKNEAMMPEISGRTVSCVDAMQICRL